MTQPSLPGGVQGLCTQLLGCGSWSSASGGQGSLALNLGGEGVTEKPWQTQWGSRLGTIDAQGLADPTGQGSLWALTASAGAQRAAGDLGAREGVSGSTSRPSTLHDVPRSRC